MGVEHGKSAVILLAEDDPGDQELTRRALDDDVEPVRLFIVPDGEAAMDYLLQRGVYGEPGVAPRPDLLLLDLNMPKLDGSQVLRRIRAEPSLHRLPVVVVTTSKYEADVDRSYDLGCNCFVSKPMDIGPFMSAIRSVRDYWTKVAMLPSM